MTRLLRGDVYLRHFLSGHFSILAWNFILTPEAEVSSVTAPRETLRTKVTQGE